MLERNPDIGAGGEDFQPCAYVGIRVAHFGESFPIQLASGGGRRVRRKRLLFKKLVPRLLRVKSCVVDDRPGFRFGVFARKNAELLFGTSILSREAKQLKQKDPLRRVGRVLAQVRREPLFRFPHLACREQFFSGYRHLVPARP